jgi:hypothetical protein
MQLFAKQQLPPVQTGLGPVATLRGVIRDVNLPRNQFLLVARAGEHRFVMAPRCKIKEGGRLSDLRDLTVGDEVSVLYEMKGGVRLAHSVLIHRGPS